MTEEVKTTMPRWVPLLLGLLGSTTCGMLLYAWSVLIRRLNAEFGWSRAETSMAYVDPKFWLLNLAYFCSSFAGLMVIGHIAGHKRDAGLSPMEAAGVVSAFAIVNAATRVHSEWFVDKIGIRTYFSTLFALQVAGMLLLYPSGSIYWALWAVAALLGWNYGAMFTLFPTTCLQFYGPSAQGCNYGLLFTAWELTGLAGSDAKRDEGRHALSQEVQTGGFMRNFRVSVIVGFVLLVSMALCDTGYSCTTFIIGERDHQLFGRNYDFGFGDGYIVINKRGVSKAGYRSRMEGENGRPAVWSSRFGSITFNQYGREFPQGGMNEAGLVVETMTLMSTRFPQPDSRPYLPNTLLWRQYLLDTCASVKDVLDSDSKVRVSYDASKGIGTHFLILDREGNAAVIEFLDGKMVIHLEASLPVRVLTNSTYEESLSFWQNKTFPAVDPWDSIHRFVTAVNLLGTYSTIRPKSERDYSFDILTAVTWLQTKWSIVYDNRNLKISYTTVGNTRIRTIDVSQFDFSCKSPVKILDINNGLEGDITQRFQDYTQEINASLVKTSFGKLESRVPVPDQVIEFMSKYPEQCECRE